jgi:hypothetical protein
VSDRTPELFHEANYEVNELFVELYSSRDEGSACPADKRHEPRCGVQRGSCRDVADYSLWSLSCTVPAIFSIVFGSSVVP